MEPNQKLLLIYNLLALLIPLLLIRFTTKEITGCTNEVAKGANKAGRNLPSCFFFLFFFLCLRFSVIPSINTFESSNGFWIRFLLWQLLSPLTMVLY